MAHPKTRNFEVFITNALDKHSVFVKLTADRHCVTSVDSSKTNYSKSAHSKYDNKQRENKNYHNDKQHDKDSLYNKSHVSGSYNFGMHKGSADNEYHRTSDHLSHNISNEERKKSDESAVSGLTEDYSNSSYHAQINFKTIDPGYTTITSGKTLPFPVETSSDIVYIYAYIIEGDEKTVISNGQQINRKEYEIQRDNKTNDVMIVQMKQREQNEWRDILNQYRFPVSIQDKMEDEGWDDKNLWKDIDDTIMNELGFKSGHKAKFKKMIQQLFPPEPKPERSFAGCFMFENVSSGYRMDVSNEAKHSGADVTQCKLKHGNKNQQFEVQSLNDGWYIIRCVDSGKYLDINRASLDNGAKLIQSDHNGNENQQFRFVKKGGPNVYGIQVRHSSKWLGIKGGNIVQGEWINDDIRKWRFLDCPPETQQVPEQKAPEPQAIKPAADVSGRYYLNAGKNEYFDITTDRFSKFKGGRLVAQINNVEWLKCNEFSTGLSKWIKHPHGHIDEINEKNRVYTWTTESK